MSFFVFFCSRTKHGQNVRVLFDSSFAKAPEEALVLTALLVRLLLLLGSASPATAKRRRISRLGRKRLPAGDSFAVRWRCARPQVPSVDRSFTAYGRLLHRADRARASGMAEVDPRQREDGLKAAVNRKLRWPRADVTLVSAVKDGSVDCIRALLHRGAHTEQVDEIGLTPLLAATRAGNTAAIEVLLDAVRARAS